jgi:serine/threonine protein kinase
MPFCVNCGAELPPGSAGCPNCTTQVRTKPEEALPHISGYEILQRLGEGGMGAIYLAEEKSLGRRVAIKVMAGKFSAEEQARARFAREARALATIEHANVVRVYSFGEVDGQPYLAMEYVDGETLADRIRRLGRLPVEEAVRFTREIVVGLDAAWEQGIVHRDIKPSNVLVDRRGNVHVADFGLAKARQLADDMILTQSGHVLGTPYYVAPEQAQGKATDFRADIYSTGILLFEMLAGERPFEGTTPFTVVAKHINEPLPSIRTRRPEVPSRVARIIERMTQKQPEQRPPSYAELIATFDALLGTTPRSIPRTETFSKMPRPAKTDYRVPVAFSAAVILAVIGWQAYRISKERHSPASQPVANDQRMVVAVAPFYGPDDDSAKEGRVMGALIERSITSRLGANNVRVVGIDETKEPVRSHDTARQLGERVRAAVVVWGEAFALKRETEIQPYFTLVRPQTRPEAAVTSEQNAQSADVAAADASLRERSASAVRVEAEAPNQIDLRKTSAEGVGEMVSLLAAIHALYYENNAQKSLMFFDQAPRTAESLRHRASEFA